MTRHGSTFGAGNGPGTSIQPGATATAFSAINLVETVVADRFVSPADTPTANELRAQTDATATLFWYYSLNLADWVAVELTA